MARIASRSNKKLGAPAFLWKVRVRPLFLAAATLLLVQQVSGCSCKSSTIWCPTCSYPGGCDESTCNFDGCDCSPKPTKSPTPAPPTPVPLPDTEAYDYGFKALAAFMVPSLFVCTPYFSKNGPDLEDDQKGVFCLLVLYWFIWFCVMPSARGTSTPALLIIDPSAFCDRFHYAPTMYYMTFAKVAVTQLVLGGGDQDQVPKYKMVYTVFQAIVAFVGMATQWGGLKAGHSDISEAYGLYCLTAVSCPSFTTAVQFVMLAIWDKDAFAELGLGDDNDDVKTLREPLLGLGELGKSAPNCPGGHGLDLFLSPNASFGCNGCGESVDEGDGMYGCRECNHDLCAACFQAATLESAMEKIVEKQEEEIEIEEDAEAAAATADAAAVAVVDAVAEAAKADAAVEQTNANAIEAKAAMEEAKAVAAATAAAAAEAKAKANAKAKAATAAAKAKAKAKAQAAVDAVVVELRAGISVPKLSTKGAVQKRTLALVDNDGGLALSCGKKVLPLRLLVGAEEEGGVTKRGALLSLAFSDGEQVQLLLPTVARRAALRRTLLALKAQELGEKGEEEDDDEEQEEQEVEEAMGAAAAASSAAAATKAAEEAEAAAAAAQESATKAAAVVAGTKAKAAKTAAAAADAVLKMAKSKAEDAKKGAEEAEAEEIAKKMEAEEAVAGSDKEAAAAATEAAKEAEVAAADAKKDAAEAAIALAKAATAAAAAEEAAAEEAKVKSAWAKAEAREAKDKAKKAKKTARAAAKEDDEEAAAAATKAAEEAEAAAAAAQEAANSAQGAAKKAADKVAGLKKMGEGTGVGARALVMFGRMTPSAKRKWDRAKRGLKRFTGGEADYEEMQTVWGFCGGILLTPTIPTIVTHVFPMLFLYAWMWLAMAIGGGLTAWAYGMVLSTLRPHGNTKRHFGAAARAVSVIVCVAVAQSSITMAVLWYYGRVGYVDSLHYWWKFRDFKVWGDCWTTKLDTGLDSLHRGFWALNLF